MDIQEFTRHLAEAQAKLDPASGFATDDAPPSSGRPAPSGGAELSRREQLILLAGHLMGQSTRKEKRYGQA